MRDILTTTILAVAVAGSVYAAPAAQWATPLNNEQDSRPLTTIIHSPSANNNRHAASYSFKMPADVKINNDSKPSVGLPASKSRQYWRNATAKELSQGIKLSVTGGKVIIHMSPSLKDQTGQITPADIEIRNNGIATNFEVISPTLQTTGTFSSNQLIILTVEARPSSLTLKANVTKDDSSFVIHVFEKDSPVILEVSADRTNYGTNQDINIKARMVAADKSIPISLRGYINRPDGSLLGELSFIRENDSDIYIATLNTLNAGQGMSLGLWEVHVIATGIDNQGNEVFMREADTAFGVIIDIAEFTDNLKMSADNLQVGINVGVAGRYSVEGILMGSNRAGELQPIARIGAADWLEIGQQSISLPLDAEIIAETGFLAPFTIINIKLTSLSYMAPVQIINTGINIQFPPGVIGKPRPPVDPQLSLEEKRIQEKLRKKIKGIQEREAKNKKNQ